MNEHERTEVLQKLKEIAAAIKRGGYNDDLMIQASNCLYDLRGGNCPTKGEITYYALCVIASENAAIAFSGKSHVREHLNSGCSICKQMLLLEMAMHPNNIGGPNFVYALSWALGQNAE